MRKHTALALTALAAAAVPMLGCPSPCPPDTGTPPTTIPVASRNYTTGLFPQPNGATSNDLLQAVSFAVANHGKTMLIPTPVNWNDGINQANYDQQRDFYQGLGSYIEGVGGKTYYAVDFWGDENRTSIAGLPAALGSPADFSNPNVCPQMIGWLTDLAATTPAKMGIGIEVNYYKYLAGSLRPSYSAWVSCYEAAYTAIKAVSPSTQVFPTFLLEDMKGLLNQSPADTAQFNDYNASKVDLLAFSSFPGISAPPVFPNPPYATPAAVPANYWSGMVAVAGAKKILVGETGWSNSCGFDGAPSIQAEWANKAMTLAQPIATANKLDGLLWYFMSDPPAGQVIGYFAQGGLYEANGTARPAANLWNLHYQLNPGL